MVPKNLFKLFGINTPVYNLNKNILKNNYISLLKLTHPDYWTYSSKNIINTSHNLSTYINKAYSILNHDVNRGKYLLYLNDYNYNEATFRYIYTTNKEINDFFEKHLYLDDEIELYCINNMKNELKKLQYELQVQYKLHFNEATKYFERKEFIMVSYHLHMLKNLSIRLNKITNN